MTLIPLFTYEVTTLMALTPHVGVTVPQPPICIPLTNPVLAYISSAWEPRDCFTLE